MHQRADIPRHRVPGSREYRYLRSELLGWLKGAPHTVSESASAVPIQLVDQLEPVVDISSKRVYHRNPRYQ
jgi:hypothetical protein